MTGGLRAARLLFRPAKSPAVHSFSAFRADAQGLGAWSVQIAGKINVMQAATSQGGRNG
jgi:hypothetical protein